MRKVEGMAENSQQLPNNEIEGAISVERELEFRKMPMVFRDGYSRVWISLIGYVVICKGLSPISRSIYEGCFVYDDDGLRSTSGFYYVRNGRPFLKIDSRRFAYSKEDTRRAVKDLIRFINTYINTRRRKLLIDFNTSSYMRIYDNAIKGLSIKFPLLAQQGNLYIIKVPPVPSSVSLRSDKYGGVRIYNHMIEFDSKVEVFDIPVISGGRASLVYNNNDEEVEAKLISEGYEMKTVKLKGKTTYLFTHPEPQV